ncbi:ap-4 complex subunit mu-1 [Anaeramoeba ignava]|uniref:Ap-4 complex subunit mu-1 n=1 Tax=Anaeramoeba ignava TaxID=1746090 RepID=A0A9Q0LM38_ANAIG|nr:ap-4 complex subunit mu-1 [Anaeramoeba ignava]
MISQFVILSPRGNNLILRNFRNDIKEDTSDIIFRKLNFEKISDFPPVFHENGINYAFIKYSELIFFVTSRFNISSSFLFDFLDSILTSIKDFCGVFNEQTVIDNFGLIYELVDEMIDYGAPQLTETKNLKKFIFNETKLDAQELKNLKSNKKAKKKSKKSISSDAKKTPISGVFAGGGFQTVEEIYIDIIEKLHVEFSNNGSLISSQCNGLVMIKNFLSGNPILEIGLNENIKIGSPKDFQYFQGIFLEDVLFYHKCDSSKFEESGVLQIIPPEGEFILMKYRVSETSMNLPFQIATNFEEFGQNKLEIRVTITSDFEKAMWASNVQISFLVPEISLDVKCELEGNDITQTAKFQKQDHLVVWKLPRFNGEREESVRVTLTLPLQKKNYPKQINAFQETISTNTQLTSANTLQLIKGKIGPICLSFDFPDYSVLKMKTLKTTDQNRSYVPTRWIREFSKSDSYFSWV